MAHIVKKSGQTVRYLDTYMNWWQGLSHDSKLFYNDNKPYNNLTGRQVQILYQKYYLKN